MKVLIIGCKGFIGTHVFNNFCKQDQCLAWGCDVVVDYVSKNYFQVDASNADFNEIFEQVKFDVCINCSGAASVPDSLLHPLRDYYLNTVIVFKILEAIRKHAPVCKFLNLSSAAVYGNPVRLPVKETDPVQPLSPYGCHKYQSEIICKEFATHFGIATCSVRIFSAYGPGLKKQLFWDVWQKINKETFITLFGTGKESRDFIYISDLVTALHCILDHGEFNGGSYNIANGESISIATVISTYSTFCDKNISFQFSGEERKGDPLNWQADISLLKNIGYKQKIHLDEGINSYVQWLKGL
jgi:UDP-glucose 4-epimerase